MITGDLDVALREEIAALGGEIGALGKMIGAAGLWRPAPPGQDATPGTYATPVAFRLAARAGPGPAVAGEGTGLGAAADPAGTGLAAAVGAAAGPGPAAGHEGTGPYAAVPAGADRGGAGPAARAAGADRGGAGPAVPAGADRGGVGPAARAGADRAGAGRAAADGAGADRADGRGGATSAAGSRGDPARIAARLAGRLRRLDWVAAATVTGGGYLTVTVTPEALAALAVRITQAGPACARSTALAGTSLTAPRDLALAAASTWGAARRRLMAARCARLAQAAGADVLFYDDSKRMPPPTPATSAGHASVADPARTALAGPATSAGRTPVADAIAFAGADAVTLALARVPPGAPTAVDAASMAAHRLTNPAYAVRFAHAHAASALRQAADLGLGLGDAATFQPRSLTHPSEQSLLYELSWLPERVAGAARRGRPDVLARYLETLAVAYLNCQQHRPAAWPGMSARASPRARLWLAAAAGTALRTGLDLLGVSAPDRL